MSDSKKLVHEIRIGSVRASFWANDGKNGGTWFNVAVTRRYKDKNDWHDTSIVNSGYAGWRE